MCIYHKMKKKTIYDKDTGTSTMMQHLKITHNTNKDTKPLTNYTKIPINNNTFLSHKMQLEEDDSNKIHHTIARFIVDKHLPFHLVESVSFRMAEQSLNPGYTFMS